MSSREFAQVIRSLIQLPFRVVNRLTKWIVNWLLRGLLQWGRSPRLAQSGFVLPTTVLLLLVLLLTVGSITYRTYTRTTQTVGERQQRVIYNAATPAIDRAKAKIEYLFDSTKDTRFPGGVPSEDQLWGMMLNQRGGTTLRDLNNNPSLTVSFLGQTGGYDPYTFPDERRVDIGDSGVVGDNTVAGDTSGNPDNAWRYRVDQDGDGQNDATVVYSINFRTPKRATPEATAQALRDTVNVDQRAQNLQVRQGPQSNASDASRDCGGDTATNLPEAGWTPSPIDSSTLRKNFQIDAYVVPDSPTGTVATLEVQQDRELLRGNKWGAWFRYDLEIFPGPTFRMNGAMHTQGSLLSAGDGGPFMSYMISAPSSCLYTPEASEITVNAERNANGDLTFQGQFIAGWIVQEGARNSNSQYYIYNGPNTAPAEPPTQLINTTDSLRDGVAIADVTLDPVAVQTEDRNVTRGNLTPAQIRDPNWANSAFTVPGRERMRDEIRPNKPYVDDSYRADDRLGPRPNYGRAGDTAINQNIGADLRVLDSNLIKNGDQNSDRTDVGLDGYWERRARREGVRVIVGQRLELGDPAGWGGPVMRASPFNGDRNGLDLKYSEPLRPYDGCEPGYTNCAATLERRQRLSLWDNLAAVQATTVYHADFDLGNNRARADNLLDQPLACLASTVHPGTAGTLDRSATFENLAYGLPAAAFAGSSYATTSADASATLPPIISDFLRGRGTNGWEFVPPAIDPLTETGFDAEMTKALRNLSYLAGDPNGGAPSFTPPTSPEGGVSDNAVHPFPSLAMWGDFSALRRVFRILDGTEPGFPGAPGRSYAQLSPADKTTLHTAACALGMLAYNLDYLDKFTPFDAASPGNPISALNGLIGTPPQAGNTLPTASGELTLRDAIQAIRDGKTPLGWISELRSIPSVPAGGPTGLPQNFMGPQPTLTSNPSTAPGGGQASANDQVLNGRRVGNIQYNDDPEVYVRLLERWRNIVARAEAGETDASTAVTNANALFSPTVALTSDRLNQLIYLAQLLISKYQVERDRTYGFGGSGDNADLMSATNDPALGVARSCITHHTDGDDPLIYLCSTRPRYPILYNLFPYPAGTPTPANAPASGAHPDATNTAAAQRGFARDSFDSSDLRVTTYLNAVNTGISFEPVDLAAIRLRPRLGTTTDGWQLPVSTTALAGSQAFQTSNFGTPTNNRDTLIKVCFLTDSTPCLPTSLGRALPTAGVGEFWRVGFKDSAFYDGRQQMSVRALNVNLDLLRKTRLANNPSRDFWLPATGVIYAFREDAMSELSIVRPLRTGASWTACNTDAELQSATCRMDVVSNAYNSKDPPVNVSNTTGTKLLSPKPVDYYMDPDRRPNGFRLMHGAEINRGAANPNGLSFVSYNPVYVQGDFNLHRDAGGTRLEEFTALINPADTWTNFYTRTGADRNFARPATDLWRPSEVMADAVTILSNNFCDGSIQDLFLTAGTAGDGTTFANVKVAGGGTSGNEIVQGVPHAVAGRYGCPDASGDRSSYMNGFRPGLDFFSSNNIALDGTNIALKNIRWLRTNLADTMAVSKFFTNTTFCSTLGIVCNPYGTADNTDANAARYKLYVEEGDSPIVISPRGNPYMPRNTGLANYNNPSNDNNTGAQAIYREYDRGPVFFNANGNAGSAATGYFLSQSRSVAAETRVNAIIVSGIVPSRFQQSYGGLHNFPRFLENWGPDGRVPMYISGSLLQLSFSNQATAPQDQDAIEVGAVPTNSTPANYYVPPGRRWGYDPGLQIAPAGPVASRFITVQSVRSEFYTEPPADDAYMARLRSCATANIDDGRCSPISQRPAE